MKIYKAMFSKCPAWFTVFYTDDNGEDKYIYGLGFATCYTCPDYMFMQIARGGDTE